MTANIRASWSNGRWHLDTKKVLEAAGLPHTRGYRQHGDRTHRAAAMCGNVNRSRRAATRNREPVRVGTPNGYWNVSRLRGLAPKPSALGPNPLRPASPK